MKIEKISDTQIRCTLNKNDLADRHLRISELAYGSDKAKALFRDMMQQASAELGFDADNIPLMIEAIPVSADCLILVITKVEDPDELDTRFSSFTPARDEEEDSDSLDLPEDATADQILQYFEQMGDLLADRLPFLGELKQRALEAVQSKNGTKETPEFRKLSPEELAKQLARAFRFSSLSEVTSLAAVIAPFYRGSNTLYKNPLDSSYHLVLHISEHKPVDYNKVCNIASEYGSQEHFSDASAAYFEEHYECIVKDRAVQMLERL